MGAPMMPKPMKPILRVCAVIKISRIVGFVLKCAVT
jgi:hypothetical protein